MEIREAVEADAERMADIAESPADVMRNLIHDRTVRVAYRGDDEDGNDEEADETADGADADTDIDADADDGSDIVALVSFDALQDTVHVTQLAGPTDACKRLLEEPIRFAEGEDMSVELLVPSGDESVESAAQAAGFAATGSGPEFEDRKTTRYRLEPGKAEQ